MAAAACSLASLSRKFPAQLCPAHSQPPPPTLLTVRKVVAVGWAATVAVFRSASRVSKVARNGRNHDEMETVLASLHPQLAAAVRQALSTMPKAEILLIGPKEEIGGVKGVPLEDAKNEPRSLRELPHDCYDLIVEVQSEELQSRSWEAVQNRFYPLGGHSFSLANDFIINLASICKVLRNGGKFLFLSVAKSQEEVLPFSFLKLPHLKWQVDVESTGDCSDAVSIVCCTLSEDATSESLKLTPRIIEEQCTDEISRRRYFEALKPFLVREDVTRILDYGCGDGSLMSWVLESLPTASPEITLVEANPELAARASSKLPGAKVLHHEGEPWPFADLQFDVVVLAFVLHHVDVPSRAPMLAEAQRVAHKILILEDLPGEAASPEAKRLAWHITEEHFRPFGQDPNDYIAGVLPRERWTEAFQETGLEILSSKIIAPNLRYPVSHILFELTKT